MYKIPYSEGQKTDIFLEFFPALLPPLEGQMQTDHRPAFIPGPVALMDLSATRISVRQIATRRRNTQIRKSAVQLESGIIRKQTAAVPPLVDITSMGISTCASLLQSPVPLALEPLKRICEIAYRPPTHSFSSSFPSFFFVFVVAPNRERDNFPLRWDDMVMGGGGGGGSGWR